MYDSELFCVVLYDDIMSDSLLLVVISCCPLLPVAMNGFVF